MLQFKSNASKSVDSIRCKHLIEQVSQRCQTHWKDQKPNLLYIYLFISIFEEHLFAFLRQGPGKFFRYP